MQQRSQFRELYYKNHRDVVGLPSSNLAQILLISDNGLDAEQQLEPGGKFNFPNLLPGTYRVQIMLASVLGDGMQPSMRVLGVSRPIEVNNEEISQLHLQVEQGSSVAGRFRMDNGHKFDWTQLNVMLVPSEQHAEIALGDTLQRPNFSAVAKDGTFEVKNVQKARYSLIVLARGSADAVRDYFTKSVMLDGQDVINSGFEATPGTALEVVISAKGATIEGTVVDDKGNPAPSVTVLDVPSPEQNCDQISISRIRRMREDTSACVDSIRDHTRFLPSRICRRMCGRPSSLGPMVVEEKRLN